MIDYLLVLNRKVELNTSVVICVNVFVLNSDKIIAISYKTQLYTKYPENGEEKIMN